MAKKIAILILTVILALGLAACAKEPVQMEVTFVGLNDKAETKTVALGEPVAFPQTPREDGYEFLGWFLDESEPKTEVISGFKPAENTTLYAHFRELDVYTVTFVDHNGNDIQSFHVREDQRFDFPTDLNFTIEDEKYLDGWYIEGTETRVDADYFMQNPVTESMRIVAKCTDKETYTLTLMVDGVVFKEYTTRDDLEFTFNAQENIPVKENYRFEGWFNGAVEYQGEKPTENITYEAKFSLIEMFIAFPAAESGTCIISKLDEYYLHRVTSLDIPETLTVNGVECKVVSIAEEAFAGASVLAEIKIPKTVKNIAPNAFRGCSELTSIHVAPENEVYESNNSNAIVIKETKTLLVACQGTTVYEGILAIGKDAFLSCKKLTKLQLPASVKDIPVGFLSGCNAVEKIEVAANNADYIGINNCLIRLSDACLIQGCKASVLPEKFTVNGEEKSILSIAPEAFAACTTLTKINIPASVKVIVKNTFKDCVALTTVIATEPTLVMEDGAFAGCEAITNVTVTYEHIKYFLSHTQKRLKSITITDAEKIEASLFAGCTALQTVKLPKSLITIEKDAFRGCSALTAVLLEKDAALAEIREHAFFECTALVAFAVETADAEPAFLLPESVKTISYRAFASCTSLTEITLSAASVVDYDAFIGCNHLKKATLGANVMRCLLVVADQITELNIIAGEAPDYETVRAMTALETFSLSKDITTIDAMSLRACTRLVNIKIDAANTTLKVENDYVLEIASGKLIFAAAKPEITIGADVKVIGAYAFMGTGIESIVIPATVEKIEAHAFSACRSLASLEILGKPVIEDLAFEGCDAIKTVKAYEFAYKYLNKVTIETKETIPEANA